MRSGYITERKRMQMKQRKKALLGQVCTVDRRGMGIILFQVRGRGKEPFFLWEWVVRESILFDERLSFVR